MNDTETVIKQFFYDILDEEPQITIEIAESEVNVELELAPEHSGIVIGYRGEVLAALQLILSLMVQESKEVWLPVRLNVNNYREQRAEALENLAHNTAQRVLDTDTPLSLPNLSSYERRLIHSALSEVEGVISYSEGSGYNRVLIIAPSD